MITGEKGFIGSRLIPYDDVNILYHCAWHGRDKESRNNRNQYQNIDNSIYYFNKALRSGVQKIVALGSQGEFNDDFYGEAKREVKKYLFELADNEGIQAIWIRLYSVYGEGDHPSTLISSVIRKLKERKSIHLSDCNTLWDYLYISDAIRAIIKIANQIDDTIELDVGYGSGIPIKTVTEYIKTLIDQEGTIIYKGKDKVSKCIADTTKVTRLTDWIPRITIHEGLRRTVNWELLH